MKDKIKNVDFIQIESDIILNNNLTSTDKILYGYLSVLTRNDKNECYASTKYLSQLMNLSSRQVKRCISNLKKYNYIKVRVVDNNKRYITTTIHEFVKNREKINREKLRELEELAEYNWLEDEEEPEYE